MLLEKLLPRQPGDDACSMHEHSRILQHFSMQPTLAMLKHLMGLRPPAPACLRSCPSPAGSAQCTTFGQLPWRGFQASMVVAGSGCMRSILHEGQQAAFRPHLNER